MQQVVAIFGVFVDFHKLNEQLSNCVFFESVNSTVTVFVWQDQTQSGIEIRTNFFAPSSDEALNDVSTLFMRRKLVHTTESLSRACTDGILLLILIEGVEDFSKQFREDERL